jgi:hypothetical protein
MHSGRETLAARIVSRRSKSSSKTAMLDGVSVSYLHWLRNDCDRSHVLYTYIGMLRTMSREAKSSIRRDSRASSLSASSRKRYATPYPASSSHASIPDLTTDSEEVLPPQLQGPSKPAFKKPRFISSHPDFHWQSHVPGARMHYM